MRRTRIGNAACFLLAMLCFYAGAACLRYRFRHPDLTETQLLQRLPEALAWKE